MLSFIMPYIWQAVAIVCGLGVSAAYVFKLRLRATNAENDAKLYKDAHESNTKIVTELLREQEEQHKIKESAAKAIAEWQERVLTNPHIRDGEL